MGAPIGPRWSSTGLLAIPGYRPSECTSLGPECWARVTILDPKSGATRSLGQLSLFGGGPSIVWTRDASGIWDGGRIRPVDGGQAGPIGPNVLFMDRRVGAGGRGGSNGTVYASDGRSLLTVSEQVVDGHHLAIVKRNDLNGPAIVEAQWQLPDGAFEPQLGEPDPSDTEFPIWFATGSVDSPDFTLGPILHLDGTTAEVAGGDFLGWVPAALAETWAPISPTQ
jgi:hypothetical protein